MGRGGALPAERGRGRRRTPPTTGPAKTARPAIGPGGPADARPSPGRGPRGAAGRPRDHPFARTARRPGPRSGLQTTDFGLSLPLPPQSSRDRRRRAGPRPPDACGVAVARRRDRRLVLFPERDEHVAFVLRNWDAVREIADVPLPSDPDVTWSLRRKQRLVEVAADAGVPFPATIHADAEQAVRESDLRPPFLIKPVEGQDFALHFGEKVMVADYDRRGGHQVASGKGGGFRDPPAGVHPRVLVPHLVAARLHRPGRPPAGSRRRPEDPSGAAALRHERLLRGRPRRPRARPRPAAARPGGLPGHRPRGNGLRRP